MPTTVNIPLQLLTVSLANANAFWTAKDGTNYDFGFVAFKDAVTGTATFWGIVPQNVAATPAWNLILWHGANAGVGGNVILNVKAKDFADAATIDAALTALETGLSLATGASGLVQKDATNAGDYDVEEALAAGNLLIVEITRDGGNVSDTVGDQWNLHAVVLRIDV